MNSILLYLGRYYAIATPSATQRLLLGLLEAPPSWAPDALDAAVQLVELLRAAEDYASGIRVSSTILLLRADILFYQERYLTVDFPFLHIKANHCAFFHDIASNLCIHCRIL